MCGFPSIHHISAQRSHWASLWFAAYNSVRTTNFHCVCARKHQSHKRTEIRRWRTKNSDAIQFVYQFSLFFSTYTRIASSQANRTEFDGFLLAVFIRHHHHQVSTSVRACFNHSTVLCAWTLYVLISINFPGCRYITSMPFRPTTTRFSLVLPELN